MPTMLYYFVFTVLGLICLWLHGGVKKTTAGLSFMVRAVMSQHSHNFSLKVL